MCTLCGCKSLQETFDQRIARYAATRYGVFSRHEAKRMGATRSAIERRLATGRWERLMSGVYRLAGVASSWPQSLYAECLGWGAGALVSHRAAGELFELAGFHHRIVELIVPRGRHRGGSSAIVHQLVRLEAVDRTVVNQIPVTTPARTLIDIAAVVSPEVVEEALDDALRRRLVSIPRLRWQLARTAPRGRTGIGVIRALLAARDSVVEVPKSVFETHLLRLIREAGLSLPVRQHQVRDRGRLVAIVDFAYPDRKLAIEADGYRWHSGRARWEHDLARRNALSRLGWSVVHVTWEQLRRKPNEILDDVRARLRD